MKNQKYQKYLCNSNKNFLHCNQEKEKLIKNLIYKKSFCYI